ncbi:HlyD family secretion protein [Hephaestia sp. GCM10023244]|nr:HlyD family secretion protein [Hephaestia sp. MAHUQ-44]
MSPSFDPPPAGATDPETRGHDVAGDALIAGREEADPEPSGGRRRVRTALLLLGPIVLLLAGIAYYLHGGRYETTDNAYLQSGQGAVSPNIAGRVIAVEVRNNQHVKQGDILFRIDPAPYQAAADEAEAALAGARTGVASLRANYRQGQAELTAAQDKLRYAEREAARQKALLAEGISSQNQYDQAVLAAQNARSAIVNARQANESVAAQLTGSVTAPVDRQPAVAKAQAVLERARLNLGYTVVRAAQDGIVTKVDQLQVGNYVNAGQPVFTLVGDRVWVEANFKESQLHYMRLGQPATIEIDAFPGLKLKGHLSSFSPGTGNSFSVLPAENATGNWVKVVQRLAVEITIDNPPAEVPLHAGLSVEATVDTGHKRRLFGTSKAPATPAR